MARRKTRFETKIAEECLNENLPMDILPYSNGEHFPEEPTRQQLEVMKLMDEEVERVRRVYGMSRREFVRTAAAMTIGLWAINQLNPGKWGYFADGSESIPKEIKDPNGQTVLRVSGAPTWDACELNNPGVQLANLPGEFVFDVQTHHITDQLKWRVLQPVHMAFICGFFGVAGQGDKTIAAGPDPTKGNIDPCDNVGRWEYFKDIYLDSATTSGVLSPIPSAPDEQQPLPFAEANKTAELMESVSGTMRIVTHGYVMPNRGTVRSLNAGRVPYPVQGSWPEPIKSSPAGQGTGTYTPSSTGAAGYPFLQDELDWMEERALKYRHFLRGWKVYTPYGDVPFSSGMGHDEECGVRMNEQIQKLNVKYGVPKVLASHKGVWLPTFDDRRQACDDVPAAAKAFPDIRFVIYHSAGGWKGQLYPGDGGTNPDASGIPKDDYLQGIRGLLKNLKDADWDAQAHIPSGLAHGNSPNVHVDLGSVLPSTPDNLALFFGTMIKHLGARRICWGTDSIWGGSPHADIVRVRALRYSPDAKTMFDLPYGLNGDRFDPRVRAYADPDDAGPFDYSHYSQAYLTAHPALQDAAIGGNWPTDGLPHPERSIRNGILGRNAADAYEHDADALYKEMSCDALNQLREQYLGDEVNGLASIGPARANTIYGPRTKQDTIAMLNEDWKKNGWRA